MVGSLDLQGVLQELVICPPQSIISGQILNRLMLDLVQDEGAFGVTPDQAEQVAIARAQQVVTLYPQLNHWCQQVLSWQHCPVELLWRLWLPLAEDLATTHQAMGRPLVQGILGLQGTGKTTLARILGQILQSWGFTVCQLSIDDLYKTHAERQQLRLIDPRLRWRGPPGTHDVDLGIQILQQLRSGSPDPVEIPRFDKSAFGGDGDRTVSDLVSGADIILFEGWFVGMRPVDPAVFDLSGSNQLPSPIDTESDRQFARDMNARLRDYLPLWDLLDRLMVLHPVDYHLSLQWRKDAERKMIEQGKSGMTEQEIEQFVAYFWRSLHPAIFLPPLLHNPQWTDLVVEIEADHCPGKIFRINHR